MMITQRDLHTASANPASTQDDPLRRPCSQENLHHAGDDRMRPPVVMRYMIAGVLDPLAAGVTAAAGDPPFRARERNLLQLKSGTLSPRERQVLRLLLTDLSEKEIAYQLGLGWRTTHGYTVSILRKFDVKGRIGLMALWLRHSCSSEITCANPAS